MNYEKFISEKSKLGFSSGFEIKKNIIGDDLYPFQKAIVKMAVKKGSFCVFADCGLGKTLIQLEWARIINDKIKKPILIFAPLAVSAQTIREGIKFNIDVKKADMTQGKSVNGIYITNYEQIHNVDLDSFHGIVLDESSILKSFTGKFRNEIIEKTKKTKYKLACTATPSPNDYMELGNHSEFIGRLSRKEMLSMYFIHDSGSTQKWRLKGHADKKFWEWVCDWAIMITKPSDIGFSDDGFILPKLNIIEHIVESPLKDDELFVMPAQTLQDRQKARKESIQNRTDKAKEIIGNDDGFLIWCNLNDESKEISKKDGIIEITGSHSNEYKESKMLNFQIDDNMSIVTKPKISGFGMNWQNHNKMIFLGLSDSYEQYYQAVRRCWRFGQKKEVFAHIIVSEREGSVVRNIKRKEIDHNKMAREMVKNMRFNTMRQIKGKNTYSPEITECKNFKLINGDCVEETFKMNDNSIDYSIFSPPFAELYTYSDSERDMGNAKNYDEFFKHFKYLAENIYRITKPGRLLSFHCIDIPAMKERDGYIGLKDFPGDLIRLFQDAGWIYHSRVVIWKDPLIEATRTKSLGLMHKQIEKDSTMCRQGLPDYLITMRKKGENEERVSNNGGFKQFFGESEPQQEGIKYSHNVWRKYASPVWMDIRQTHTLNKSKARSEKDEKHICPLQLDTISRAIELWSNEGDIVFSPFAGIGSEIYQAIKMKRKGLGIELKKSYFTQAVLNCKKAEDSEQMTLFQNI